MSTHSYHPEGLAENCARCETIAADPFIYMDPMSLCRLYNETLRFIEIGYSPVKQNRVQMMAIRVMESHIINQRHIETAMREAQVIAG
jgi:hypothetical protein